jgi:hypothetical protein
MDAEPGSPILCTICKATFYMSAELESAFRANHKFFHCPNGHSLSWRDPTKKNEDKDKQILELKGKIIELEEKIDIMAKQLPI